MVVQVEQMWCGLAILLCLGAGGCVPGSQSEQDEQKEPYFLTGKARVSSLDYQGAMEAFEKALEVNPRSASAHFELALLCEREETDLAGAIYHFERYLRLRPNAENAEIVRQRILGCKQGLAKTVTLAPVTQTVQRDLERLTAENRELRRQLEAWQAYYASLQKTAVPAVTRSTMAGVAVPSSSPTSLVAGTNHSQQLAARSHETSALEKTHTVRAGESLYSIAQKYGVRLSALSAANPGIDPKRLRIGQTLVIPAP